ncbi:cylicin-1 [Otolemur garnettii]|uniref:cylicin-1 n=1 Tax=Otolemur garnettii TaxID=30611 RepID=UPI000643FB7D|nr:cylicin-1 [Otolemur garnettii]
MSLPRQEVNITTYENSIPISDSSIKSWNQEHFDLTFPKPPQPGIKNKSKSSESSVTVPPEAQWIHKLL